MARSIALVLLAMLLSVQPGWVLADEPAPATFAVVGVAGATLRAEPNGASAALAIVPAGGLVTRAGPDVLVDGVVWRPVRASDGAFGYLPAGLLELRSGDDAAGSTLPAGNAAAGAGATAPAPVPASVPPGAAVPGPSAPTGLPGSASSGASASSTMAPGGAADQAPVGSGRQPTLTPAPPGPASPPAPPRPRTTVERRRGQEVTITHIDVAPAPDGREMGAGRIVVRFRPGAAQVNRTAAHRAAGAFATEAAGVPDVLVTHVSSDSVQQALAAYRSRADVAWAEPDYVRRTTVTTNDPYVGSQWGLQKIGAPIAWEVSTGTPSTRIAILDCGIFSESSPNKASDGQHGHPDLRGKVVAEKNFSDATTGPDDWCGHGTKMAGIAGARTNTSPPTGIASVGYDVQLLNGKVLNDQGNGFDSWVAAGIVWAADQGADVINMSLGGPGPCSATLQTAIDYAWNKGTVIVAAAGNGGHDGVGDPAPEAPANCSHVIAVGAINEQDARASFSNYGVAVPLAAPGVNVLTTNFVGTYSLVSGTSPAAPHVSGVAGMLVSTTHGSSNQAIVERLLQTADPIAGTGTIWGRGRLNAAAAVGPASCSPRPPVTVTAAADGSRLNVTVTSTGLGNVIRYLVMGGNGNTSPNVLLAFPTSASASQVQASPTQPATYVPQTVGTTATFQVARGTPGQPTMLPFEVIDGCGAWRTFVGGGPDADF